MEGKLNFGRWRASGTTRVKVCCIASVDEAWLAISAGASALGFVSRMPSGPGPIEEELIAQIVPAVPPGIATFLLTCESSADAVIAQQKRTRVNTIQLVDEVEHGAHEAMRETMPGVSIVQVIHVRESASIDEALAIAPKVNALLLDSGNPSLAVKELGGTGRVHDWKLSAEICERSPVPVFLAGGLNPSNAARAIEEVRPFALDVCSGVRNDGALDRTKVTDFMRAVRSTTRL